MYSTGTLDFPTQIIPKSSYVKKINMDILISAQNIFLTRRSNLPYIDTFNDLGQLREDVFVAKKFPSLSVNLLGGFFEAEHSYFRIKNKGMERWQNGNCVWFHNYLDDYEKIGNCCIIYLDGNGLHNIDIPYLQSEKTEGLKKKVDEFFTHLPKPIVDKGNYKFEGKTKICHDPTNLNYWHIEYNMIDFNGDTMLKGGKYLENFCKTVIADVISIHSSDKPSYLIEIAPKFYTKYLQNEN